MNSFLNRLNAIFCYATMVVAVLCALNVVTTLWLKTDPKVSLRVRSLQSLRNHPGAHVDYATITFDLDADLTSLFTWNTKQLFLYITAEYESKQNRVNQVVLWDRIVQTKEEAILHLKSQSGEYALIDQGNELRNNNVTFFFSWDVTPVSGVLTNTTTPESTIRFPAEYLSGPLIL